METLHVVASELPGLCSLVHNHQSGPINRHQITEDHTMSHNVGGIAVPSVDDTEVLQPDKWSTIIHCYYNKAMLTRLQKALGQV